MASAAEYGATEPGIPITEATPPRPVADYGATKLAGTELVTLGRAAGLDALTLRVFNPVGPGAPADSLPGRLATSIARAWAEGDDVRLGPLDAVRDFVDARDVARAVCAAAMASTLDSPVLNVGGGRAVVVRDLVNTMVDIAEFPGRVLETTSGSSLSGAVAWQQADISAIGKELGWRPTISLADSLNDLWRTV